MHQTVFQYWPLENTLYEFCTVLNVVTAIGSTIILPWLHAHFLTRCPQVIKKSDHVVADSTTLLSPPPLHPWSAKVYSVLASHVLTSCASYQSRQTFYSTQAGSSTIGRHSRPPSWHTQGKVPSGSFATSPRPPHRRPIVQILPPSNQLGPELQALCPNLGRVKRTRWPLLKDVFVVIQ